MSNPEKPPPCLDKAVRKALRKLGKATTQQIYDEVGEIPKSKHRIRKTLEHADYAERVILSVTIRRNDGAYSKKTEGWAYIKKAVRHPVNKRSASIETKIRESADNFELIHCRPPKLEELSFATRISPKELKSYAFELGLKFANREDEAKSGPKAWLRLRLATWIKLGCESTDYVGNRWRPDEIEKARKVLESFPEYVPNVELYRYPGDCQRFRCRWLWSEQAREVTAGAERVFVGDEPFDVDEFGACIERLDISQKASR